MLKNSHFQTPRTLGECHFQTGYRPAEPRDFFADLGHVVLNVLSCIGLLVLVPIVVFGVL